MKNCLAIGAAPPVLALVSALALAGCGGGGDATSMPTSKEEIVRLEASGELPTLERGTSLAGVDDNSNGVRDDIERFIEKKYGEPEQRKAALQMARALQMMLLVDTNDAQAMLATMEAGGKGVDCVFDTFVQPDGFLQGSRLSSDLEAMTTNTKERLKAYLAFNSAASGSVSGSFKGRGCE